jgi:hypothetical protein
MPQRIPGVFEDLSRPVGAFGIGWNLAQGVALGCDVSPLRG